VAELVGERMREAREEAGLRQADVAEVAQRFGLKWGRSSVAALEAGTRNLSIEELALMPFIAVVAGLPIDQLIRDDDKVHLTDVQFAWGRDFRRVFLAHEEREGLRRDLMARKRELAPQLSDDFLERIPLREELDPPERLEVTQNDLKEMLAADMGERVWPQLGRPKASHLAHEPWTELDRKIADKIGSNPTQVILMSHALYGRSATAERDARADERDPAKGKRALQSLRGHVARDLIAELREEWLEKGPIVESMRDEFQQAQDDLLAAERLIARVKLRWKYSDRQKVTEEQGPARPDRGSPVEKPPGYRKSGQRQGVPAGEPTEEDAGR
jgi:transcriptional regulator with XRE-family HTH domain